MATLFEEYGIIGVDLAPLRTGLNRAEGMFTGFSGKLTGLGRKAGRAFVFGIAAGVAAGSAAFAGLSAISIKLASDAEEIQSKFSIVFKGFTKDVDAFVSNLHEKFGIATTDLKSFLNGFQDLIVPMGFTRRQATGLSKDLLQLALDLSSFNNVSVDIAANSIKSALVGESEPMKKFGVILNDMTLNAELAAMGLDKTMRSATELEKVQARVNVMYKMSGDAIGDLARTSAGFANVWRSMGGRIKEIGTMFGQLLLPVATEVAGIFDAIGKALEQAFKTGALDDVKKVMESIAETLREWKTNIQDINFDNWKDQLTGLWSELTRGFEIIGKAVWNIFQKIIEDIGRQLGYALHSSLHEAMPLLVTDPGEKPTSTSFGKVVSSEMTQARRELSGEEREFAGSIKEGTANQQLTQSQYEGLGKWSSSKVQGGNIDPWEETKEIHNKVANGLFQLGKSAYNDISQTIGDTLAKIPTPWEGQTEQRIPEWRSKEDQHESEMNSATVKSAGLGSWLKALLPPKIPPAGQLFKPDPPVRFNPDVSLSEREMPEWFDDLEDPKQLEVNVAIKGDDDDLKFLKDLRFNRKTLSLKNEIELDQPYTNEDFRNDRRDINQSNASTEDKRKRDQANYDKLISQDKAARNGYLASLEKQRLDMSGVPYRGQISGLMRDPKDRYLPADSEKGNLSAPPTPAKPKIDLSNSVMGAVTGEPALYDVKGREAGEKPELGGYGFDSFFPVITEGIGMAVSGAIDSIKNSDSLAAAAKDMFGGLSTFAKDTFTDIKNRVGGEWDGDRLVKPGMMQSEEYVDISRRAAKAFAGEKSDRTEKKELKQGEWGDLLDPWRKGIEQAMGGDENQKAMKKIQEKQLAVLERIEKRKGTNVMVAG